MWFDKNNPLAVFMDKDDDLTIELRRRAYQRQRGMPGHAKIKGHFTNKTFVADFRKIPFQDEAFQLIVFDPPFLSLAGENSLFGKRYGTMNRETWPADLRLAANELWRVLKTGGVLVFKWNNHDIKFKSVLRLFPKMPLFGQISAGAKKRDGKPGHTCWFCFLKTGEEVIV
jgi:SAM-dependent methyltransferase